jgi:predicted Rossmann-fold nucleotide-binding protein
MVEAGTISPADLDLLHVTDDVAEAVAVIQAADAARGRNGNAPPPGDAVPSPAPVDD